MKKIAICIVFMSVINAQAQKIGLKAGGSINSASQKGESQYYLPNNATALGLPIQDQKMLPGFNVGFYTSFQKGNINIQPELLFSRKGYEELWRPAYVAKRNYIDLPIMFGFKVKPKLILQAGPQFGLIVDKTTNTNLKKIELGLGAGALINLSEKVGLSIRFNHGLTPFLKNKSFATLWNRSLQVGLQLPLVK
jgi:Outer membrane protein beta-barrel domain